MLNLGSHLLVDQMQAESVSGSLHLGDQVADGLDAFHLLPEVLGLKEVAEVAVALISGHLVQVEKALVDRLSSSRAASMASSGVPHSMVVGLAMSWKTTLPPLLVWYSISFMPWARSSPDSVLKCSANPWRA